MTDNHPFGRWLDGDRTSPAPKPVDAQYWLSDDDGFIRLWCHLCTAGSDDYLGEWATPPSDEYEHEATARLREHQAEHHPDNAESEA